MTDVAELRELADRWVLPYRHKRVEQVRVDYRLGLLLDEDAVVTIGAPAALTEGVITAPNVEVVHLVPEQADVAPALALLHTEVVSAVAFKSGALRIVFSNAKHLQVRPGEQYEPWEVSGPGPLRLVSIPGGDLAIWT